MLFFPGLNSSVFLEFILLFLEGNSNHSWNIFKVGNPSIIWKKGVSLIDELHIEYSSYEKQLLRKML